ncbi:MAG: outer membrane lipoprotein carrier protein LolA [Bacteroidia bacterium]|nr:outer membrane lipoprotein carrier protein LolA [Bacteroidia bacterium]
MKLPYIIGLFLLSITATAQYDGMKPVSDVPAVKKKLEENALKTQDINASFTQEKHLSILEEKITSTGTFKFKKENKVRWSYDKPYNYLIIINKDQIYINDEGKEKSYDANSSKMFSQINKIVVGTAKGTLFSDPDYTSVFSENSGFYMVQMTPKSARLRDYVNEIFLYIDKKDLSVNRLKMTEKNGDFTQVDFSAKKINAGIPDSEFQIP